ncbi:MAG: LysR substrate-binding domain-containing protein [Burkholderiales bacterium]|jgi:DNA-binding transcriptional LysR family regulator|nr:LysR substrate-binding domain-containing protein [Nitrosomonadaceae bacterium]
MHFTYRQLKVFEAVARHLNYTRAAEELHLTQPTVSMQVKELAEAVGLPLFEQIGKKTYLTEAGRELLMSTREIFDAWDRFTMTVDNLKGLSRGKLRVAIVTTAKYFVPRLLGEFVSRYPDIEVALEVANRDAVVERLSNNLDDLYVMGVPPPSMPLKIEPFLANPLVVIAPKAHALAGRTRVPINALATERFIQREKGSGTRLASERHFADLGMPMNIKMELGTNEAILQAVAGGLGIAVLSRHTIGRHAEEIGVTELDVAGFPIERSWYIVTPEGKKLSVIAKAFHDYLLQVREASNVSAPNA